MATTSIRSAAVIGAGVMGRGIAAHLANAGIPVYLLDIVPPNPEPGDDVESAAFRNRFATQAIERIAKESPALILTRRDLSLITPGNVEDHFSWLGEVDWVVEAVPENMDIKRATFKRMEDYAGPETIITSNTSGLSIEGMLVGRSDSFKERFLVTHFFNPVRYMKLLELVEAKDTDPSVTKTIEAFGRDVLGKGIVYGKDTTNFIANRIGVHGMMTIMHKMPEYSMSIEDVDAIFARPMGRPRSAVFRTADVVGLDTFVHVATNCYDTLTEDEEREKFKVPTFMQTLVDKGWLGAKTKKGFYTKTNEGILSLDLDTLEYTPRQSREFESLKAAKGSPAARVKTVVVDGKDDAAKFARDVTLNSLAYTARRLGEIADDVVNVDKALRWGFNWDLGPFEVWDAIGFRWGVAAMTEAGIAIPEWVTEMAERNVESFYRYDGAVKEYYDPFDHTYKPLPTDDREISLTILKKKQPSPVLTNSGATLHDIKDGVALLEFHTKMNSIDNDIIEMMHQTVDELESNFDALVIANDSDNFSAGANLFLVLMNARAKNWSDIENMVGQFQDANQRMRFSSKPVVAAPAGLTLGGGAEVSLGANARQASAELYMGLVEVGVGLIPGGGGTLQLMRNVFGPYTDDKEIDPMNFLKKVFMAIGMAEVSKSAEEARELGFLTPEDGVTLNRSHVIYAAKERALGMARAGFRPPRKRLFRLPGRSGIATVDAMLYSMFHNNQISEYDRHIGKTLATVLCGGETTVAHTVSEDRILELEREAFLSLCGEEKSQARMEYMLTNNKPLRN